MELQAAISKVDSKLEFDQNNWVISVFNSVQSTTGKLFGHAVILVEGLEPNKNSSLYPKLFIGQYDIQAKLERTEESFESISNRKGIISEIRIYQGNKYLNNKTYNDKFYKECQSRSFVVSKYNVLNMIESIGQDKEITDLAKQGALSDFTVKEFEKLADIEELVWKETEDFSENFSQNLFQKIQLLKEEKEAYKICDFSSEETEFLEILLNKTDLQELSSKLLKEKKAEYLKYQQYGSKGGILQALFSEKDQGVNCAEWCIEKLMIAKVPGIENDTPKPYFVSGGCSIL